MTWEAVLAALVTLAIFIFTAFIALLGVMRSWIRDGFQTIDKRIEKMDGQLERRLKIGDCDKAKADCRGRMEKEVDDIWNAINSLRKVGG